MFIRIDHEMTELVVCEFLIDGINYPEESTHIGRYEYPYYLDIQSFNENRVDYTVKKDIKYVSKDVVVFGSKELVETITHYINEFYNLSLYKSKDKDGNYQAILKGEI